MPAARAKDMTTAELEYALKDIKATLELYPDADPTAGYPAKLWAEWDAYIVEHHRRTRP